MSIKKIFGLISILLIVFAVVACEVSTTDEDDEKTKYDYANANCIDTFTSSYCNTGGAMETCCTSTLCWYHFDDGTIFDCDGTDCENGAATQAATYCLGSSSSNNNNNNNDGDNNNNNNNVGDNNNNNNNNNADDNNNYSSTRLSSCPSNQAGVSFENDFESGQTYYLYYYHTCNAQDSSSWYYYHDEWTSMYLYEESGYVCIDVDATLAPGTSDKTWCATSYFSFTAGYDYTIRAHDGGYEQWIDYPTKKRIK